MSDLASSSSASDQSHGGSVIRVENVSKTFQTSDDDKVEALEDISLEVPHGALYHVNPSAFKAALRAHRFSDPKKLEDNVFDLAYSMIAPAMPPWGNMNQEGWQKVLNFSLGAGIIRDRSKTSAAREGVLWTNKYAK